MKVFGNCCLTAALLTAPVNSFTTPSTRATRNCQVTSSSLNAEPLDRRSLLSATFASVAAGVATAVSADTGAEVRGIAVTPFNALAFQYRGTDNLGLQASDINEPSIPYSEFLTKLGADEVSFVEFMAPAGDAAYVSFKSEPNKFIRIGEGYPVEDPYGWSSPTFVVRAVKNKGVPYKFTVPALKKFQS